ncbi:hypothetical protein [uncultured Sphingomonas sp.]|uniref:hypothetical protein n=1 Tax=uncultured Sphingomonas sp. TaxID=158754 RepID=UPI0025E4DF85|nr:hypothetical protein [uncultured Sphingomonas sp.]
MRTRIFQAAHIVSAILCVPTLPIPEFLATQWPGPTDQITEQHILAVGQVVTGMTVGAAAIDAKVIAMASRKRDRTRKA